MMCLRLNLLGHQRGQDFFQVGHQRILDMRRLRGRSLRRRDQPFKVLLPGPALEQAVHQLAQNLNLAIAGGNEGLFDPSEKHRQSDGRRRHVEGMPHRTNELFELLLHQGQILGHLEASEADDQAGEGSDDPEASQDAGQVLVILGLEPRINDGLLRKESVRQ
jgi:hypothetical protein